MNVVSTWCFQPWFAEQSPAWGRTVDMLAAMRACAALAQKKFGNFSVYTDHDSKFWLQQILPNANVVVWSDNVPNQQLNFFYSRSKLFTYLEQKEEFLHIDLDFLLGPDWPIFGKSIELVGQWWEPVLDPRAAGFYNWHQEHANLKLPKTLQGLDTDAPAINTGCLLVKNLQFIHDYAHAIEDLIANNSEHISKLTVPTIEQHVLGMLVAKHNIKCSTLVLSGESYNPINNRFIHFLGRRWKNRNLELPKSIMSKTIDSWITPDLEQISHVLDIQRQAVGS